jgi:molecular chaperone GrpE (heat shock protein)
MASTCATNATNQEERIAILKKQIEEEEHRILLALQAEVRQAHEDYKNTFDKLMKSTNGQILNRLRILPTIVTHLSQSIADRNVNDYVFASSSAIKGLLMTSLQTVMMVGIEDLYEQGEMFLSGDELENFRFSKK